MTMDVMPVGVLFAVTAIVVMMAIEAGFRLGHAVQRRSEGEKESSVSAISGSILGLLAFILAFTFGIVADRYDARKALVREEANAIRTTWLRSDFLVESDRALTEGLLRDYVETRLAAVRSRDLEQINQALVESRRIQRELWDIAVANSRRDLNSDIGALYLESLNEMYDLHALRVAVGIQTRTPNGIWLVLYALVVLGMAGVGYQTAIAGSRRSWATPILALSFAMVITLIAALDRPQAGYFMASQQPLVDLQSLMDSAPAGATRPPE
jgi:hypothetical protein